MRTKPLEAVIVSVLFAAPLGAQQASTGRDYQVTGRIVMGDRSPVPLTVSVELVCNGQVRKRVRPYANGDFSVPLGTDASDSPDVATPTDLFGGQKIPFDTRSAAVSPGASAGSDAGRFDLSGCEVRAVLPGYQSNEIALGPRRLLDKPDIGQLVLRRTMTPDGTAVSANTQAAPVKARTAFDTARKDLQKEKPDYAHAARELEKAVDAYPVFSAAWNLLGRTRLALSDADGARAAFGKSISADPKYVEPYIHLARLEVNEARWGETINLMTQVQQLNPYLPDAHYLRALAHFQLAEFDAAEKWALEVQKNSDLGPYPVIHYILGAIDARRGNFDSAAVKLRQFLQTKPDAATAEAVSKILAEWAKIDQVTP